MARLTISLLGPPRVEIDGRPLEVDTRKATALLAYLAVEAERESRDRLAALLWPDRDTEHARGALRRTISSLAKGLGGRFLEIERTSIRLDPSGAWVDVSAFRDLLASGRDADAAALYRGDFMAGFGLRDAVPFEDWQLVEADSLRRAHAGALERLARAHAVHGHLVEAIDHTRRWLALDHLHEPAHRLLIELLARSGDRAAAVHQYRACVRTLDRELGVAPLDETMRLYAAINDGALAPPVIDLPPTDVPAAPTRPLVGRDRERQQLAGALAGSAPDGRLVVIEGEAGIGKTRLIDDLAELAAADGLPVARMRCSETESSLPYAVVADALRETLAAPGGRERLAALPPHCAAEAARLVPELLATTPTLAATDDPGARSRFLEGVGSALVAAARLVLIDDAHWLDDGSRAILAYLARRLRGRPVCLVLAWRTEEIPQGHPLRLLAAAAAPTPFLDVRPQRMTADDVTALARAAGLPELAPRIAAESAGLPLFVVELLAAASESDDRERALPTSLQAILATRVAAASETARQVLAAAAVLGRSFDLEVVRAVSGRADEEVVAALEELTRRRLLDEVADGYDFGHDHVRTQVYRELSLARRRLLHARAADAITTRERRDPAAQAVVIAEHLRLAGRERDAAEYFALAGERARALYAHADALTHLRSALALGHGDAPRLHEAMGDLHVLLGDYGAALHAYETGAALASPTALAELERKLGTTRERQGEYALAAVHLEKAAAAAHARGDAWAAGLAVDRALNDHRRGLMEAALSHARDALELATRAGDLASLARARNVLGVLYSAQGRHDEARTELLDGLELAEGLTDPAPRIAALNNLALVARTRGETDEAIARAEAALAACRTYGDRHREAALHGNLADALHEAGRHDEAMEHLKLGVAIFAEIGGDPTESRSEIWKLVEW